MKVVYEYCAGLDIHKRQVVATSILGAERATRTFGTMTKDLTDLVADLQGQQVTIVAMESTGPFWKPVYNLLEGSGIEAMVVNAADIRRLRTRKTDVKDAELLADLLRHGLLRGSFIPDRGQRKLRELVRYRRSLVQERAREIARLEKVLEGANIKLGAVTSRFLGVSGRAMVGTIIEGEQRAEVLAALARGRLRDKKDALVLALDGLVGPHQHFMLAEQLGHIDELKARIERLSAEIEQRLRPFEPRVAALDAIPGIGPISAQEIVAEIGLDMSRFPSSAHLASWARICPGNNQSAGKRHSGRTGPGNRWLRSALIEAALAAGRTKHGYLSAQFHRLAARRGKKRAAAVAHSILVAIYHMLRDGVPYHDLRDQHFDIRRRAAIAAHARRRLQALGYEVTIKEAA